MRINIAKSAGFCFGVKRALDIAINTAKKNTNVVMLGDIVHNEEVTSQLSRYGIKKIKNLEYSKGKILIIRAHGEPLKIFKTARRMKYKVIDATCPMVKEIHKIAVKMEKKGYRIIVIGDKKHDEVLGISGQLKKKALVIESALGLPFKKIKKIKKGCVVVQSTQKIKNTLEIVSVLKKHIPDLKFFNTICKPTRIKQAEIENMPNQNDCMIIIGSKKSANTKRLYQISKSLNKKSWQVNSKEEINPSWFRNAKKVGITAGASTPKETINEVVKQILSLSTHP
ncbi:MAG: 4-hydroxy-3-methylbut-2-enyl diphosphate reductase [Candidatus Omnitrophota bacterium]